jgi:multidrug efflux pump
MSLSATSIHRPVLAIVLSLLVILFGVIGYRYLGVREYPSVDPPIITVSANYTGANADVIESQITEPLEESISGIEGVRTLTSTSREGRSNITVEFNLGSNLETAANDVRDRVSRAMMYLPPDADTPIVLKADADAVPICNLNVQSDIRDLMELTDIATNNLREKLRTIPGVSEVQVWGGKRYAMRLWFDPVKLAAFKLTLMDVQTALNRENVELPSGRIDGMATELTVRTMGRLESVEDFNNLIIKERGSLVVRLKDIGYAELGTESYRTIQKRDGVPTVGLVLIPQPGANYIGILDEFYNRIKIMQKDLPADIRLAIGFDTSKYIRKSIREVAETVVSAFALVVLIIFLFLRDWRTTLIPVIAIPISLIGAFFIMYIADFSINVLTLLGLVLAIGIVVDDAIVVLENIYTKVEHRMQPVQAALAGSREVYFAIISTTVALVTVFLPIIFLQGLIGRLFREFGIVLAGAVLISAFVSLTLTPMMASRFLKTRQKHNRFYTWTEPFFIRLTGTYRTFLVWFLKRRWLALAAMACAVVLILIFNQVIQRELSPYEDRSGMQIRATGPEGASYELMDAYMSDLNQVVEENVPERESVISMTAPGFGSGASNSGFVRIMLKDPDKRQRSQQQISDALTIPVNQLSGGRAFITQDQSLSTSRRASLPVQYVIQAQNFAKLKEALPVFLDEARKNPVFNFVDTDLKFNKPELQVAINRDRARTLGVSALEIAQTLRLAYSGQRWGFFIRDSKQYQIIGQVSRGDRDDPMDLKMLYVRNRNGEMVRLDNLVEIKEQSSPPTLFRFNRYVCATISAGLTPGKTIGDGIQVMDEIAKKILDDTFRTELSGPSRDFSESASGMNFALYLALILIFLILSAQFESFRDPFIIMLTVPLAMGGAFLSLWYFSQTLNIFSQIGMIMLIGLVTKNGILIVEFANQRRIQGMGILEAVQDAAVSRFRPILMTSLSTFLGILPIALALGAGSESRVPMGIAVCGGLVFSTLLTLFVVPAMYSYLSKRKRSFEHMKQTEPMQKVDESLMTRGHK